MAARPQTSATALTTHHTNTLAILDPKSRGMIHKHLLHSNVEELYLTDSWALAAQSMCDREYSLILVDALLLFQDDFNALRWIKFVFPDIEIRFLN